MARFAVYDARTIMINAAKPRVAIRAGADDCTCVVAKAREAGRELAREKAGRREVRVRHGSGRAGGWVGGEAGGSVAEW